jgi:hypothetical protein
MIGVALCAALSLYARPVSADYEFDDSHFHLTNYVQKGPALPDFLAKCMGKRVGRVALFGIPLLRPGRTRIPGNFAPTYYLQSDEPLYYYSFTDAVIATAWRKLPKRDQARFDPMIEVAGEVASLTDPALDRILAFAGELGLVARIHSDIDVTFAKEGADPVYLTQMKDLLRRHPETVIIWAHTGLGRVITLRSRRRAQRSGVRATARSSPRSSPIPRCATCTSTSRGARSRST